MTDGLISQTLALIQIERTSYSSLRLIRLRSGSPRFTLSSLMMRSSAISPCGPTPWIARPFRERQPAAAVESCQ